MAYSVGVSTYAFMPFINSNFRHRFYCAPLADVCPREAVKLSIFIIEWSRRAKSIARRGGSCKNATLLAIAVSSQNI